MASIYDLNFYNWVVNSLPVLKRTERAVQWLTSLCSPLQWLHDNFFNEYANGSGSALYSGATTYATGDRVVDDLNNGVYESQATQTGVQPSTATDAEWQKVSDDWRGLRERVKYNSQKITLEYALNKWFRTNWVQPDNDTTPTRPDIYIDNNLITNLAFVAFANDADSSDAFAADLFQQNFIVDSYAFSGNWFTIYVPIAVYTALGAQADDKIKAIAGKYVIAGITYNIDQY